jgi:acyl-CoA synthetase (NDP forming)
MVYEKLPDLGSGNQGLEYLFHPRSIAVVGVSQDDANWGRMFLLPLIQFKYRGNLYPVGLQDGEIAGLKIYKSILDIPGPLDYVICCVPAPFTPQLVEDCVKKKVRAVQFFTSGFSESGEEGGKELEQKLVDIARCGGVRIIGPNSLGIYCPSQGLTFLNTVPRLARSGKIGFLFQSGGNSRELIEVGSTRGIYFSKGVSYGNACDLNESDFLEYLAQDEETEIIGIYIEGVKEGQRFFRVLKGVTRIKPTIVLKGGRTEAGSQAAVSHTGSLAGTMFVWRAVCQQTGAVLVDDLDEMMDLMLAFSYLKPLWGRRVSIIGNSGGRSVQSADICESAGLSVPSFPAEIKESLREFIPETGASIRNPVDSYFLGWTPPLFARALGILDSYNGIDLLIIDIPITISLLGFGGHEDVRTQVEAIKDFRTKCHKPLIAVLSFEGTPDILEFGFELQRTLINAGIPAYPSMTRAARALSRFIGYYEENPS